jgi:hypothetical protein
LSKTRKYTFGFRQKMSFSNIRNITKIAYYKIQQIFKIFQSKDPSLLVRAYTTYIRPSLEYCSLIWSPYFVQDINCLEKVQKLFTRKVLSRIREKPNYSNRLSLLRLESLEERRITIDLIETYKFLHDPLVNLEKDRLFSYSLNKFNTKNDLYINYSRTEIRKNWFSNRASFYWNKLPSEIKLCNNLKLFKKRLELYDLKQLCRGAYHQGITAHLASGCYITIYTNHYFNYLFYFVFSTLCLILFIHVFNVFCSANIK